MTQPFPGGVWGATPPQWGPGQSPGGKRILQLPIENWLKIRSLGRRPHPNYSHFLENIISSSMYDTTSSGVLL